METILSMRNRDFCLKPDFKMLKSLATMAEAHHEHD
jgi:hypothetical protein